jgi:hypothetical protein
MAPAQTRRPRSWPAAALAATGLVLLAGCGSAATGSSTGSKSTTANGGTSAPSDTQMDAFASCLAENGVTLPEGSGDLQSNPAPDGGAEGSAPSDAPAPGDGDTPPAPEGVDAVTWAAALEACSDTMPKG